MLEARALRIKELELGPDHVEVANTPHSLGATEWHLENYERVKGLKELKERALRIRERELGPAHLTVANTLDSLGATEHGFKNIERSKELLRLVSNLLHDFD